MFYPSEAHCVGSTLRRSQGPSPRPIFSAPDPPDRHEIVTLSIESSLRDCSAIMPPADEKPATSASCSSFNDEQLAEVDLIEAAYSDSFQLLEHPTRVAPSPLETDEARRPADKANAAEVSPQTPQTAGPTSSSSSSKGPGSSGSSPPRIVFRVDVSNSDPDTILTTLQARLTFEVLPGYPFMLAAY